MGIDHLTPDQLGATVYRQLDACVVAGPGSGKTTVLVERYRRLIEDYDFTPGQILAITFTEKAAANMKAKIADLFRDDEFRSYELESSSWISTIHGFCMRLLRENALSAGLDPRFQVLSPRESDVLQWESLQHALDEITEHRRAETLDLIEALHSPRLAADLKNAYDGIRSAGMTIEQVRAMPNPGANVTPEHLATLVRAAVREWPLKLSSVQLDEKSRLLNWCQEAESNHDTSFGLLLTLTGRLKINLQRVPAASKPIMSDLRESEVAAATSALVDRHAAPFRALIFDAFTRFDEEYRTRKIARGKVDFNDLERFAIALLRDNPLVRKRVHAQFRQVMLDEFQDINGQQAELIALLRPENVFFGVGDRNQSIYGFRHARPEIFLAYQADVAAREAQSAELFHNFRSRDPILRCVDAVLAGVEGIQERALISGAAFAAKEEPSVEVLRIIDIAADRDAASTREAAWVAHRVRQLCGRLPLGAPGETHAAEYRDFAVLCRSSDSMVPILEAFETANIPYVCGRRKSFLTSREGLDITALLSVIANPRDSISLGTLLRSPLIGIGDEALLRLRLLARDLPAGLNRFAHAPDLAQLDADDREKLVAFCHNLDRWRSDQQIIPLDMLLTRALAGCGVDWPSEPFLQLARTTGAAMDLPAFLEEIESLKDAADLDSELSDEDQGNCVQVMTAHAAKGLEFGVTIIAGMDRAARRESGPVTFTPEHGLGVKWRNPLTADKDGLKDSWSEANKNTQRAREDEEENRLLYVAMTRAEEHLILSYSRGKNRPSSGTWASRVEKYFRLDQAGPAPEARIELFDGFAASILVSDSDPPPLTALEVRGSGEESAEVVPRPVIADQHETAVTVTSLAVFGVCPRKYYIQRSLGWNSGRFRRFDPDDIVADEPDDEGYEDLSAAGLGSAVHDILAGLDPPEAGQEARRLAEVFFQSDLGRRAVSATRVAREWAFIAEIDGSLLRGKIDLWFEDDGELHLVDYKTDEAVKLDYAPQLALYAIALERATGKRPKTAWLHFLRNDTVIEIPLDDVAIHSARSLITDLRQAQDELRFDLNEGEHCRTCAFYKSLCPAGRTTSSTPPPESSTPPQ